MHAGRSRPVLPRPRPGLQTGCIALPTEAPGSAEIVRLSAMHMAHVLANVAGAVLTRLPGELQQPMFNLLCASAFESVEHVVSSHPEDVKQRVRTTTRLYVTMALHRVAGELGLAVVRPSNGP